MEDEAAKQVEQEGQSPKDETSATPFSFTIRFRNYRPRSRRLRAFYNPRPGIAELERRLEEDTTKAIDAAFQKDVLSQLAPQKPNWDIKRDIARKIETHLRKKTDVAILQLMRNNVLKQKEGGVDEQLGISAAISMERPSEPGHADDEEEDESISLI